MNCIASTLAENFLPDAYHTYQMKYYQMSDTYDPYKSFVTVYLHNRPNSVIIHYKKKSIKHTEEDMKALDSKRGTFTVHAQSGSTHTVNWVASTGVSSG